MIGHQIKEEKMEDYSTIELDLSPEIQNFLYEEMNKVALEICDSTSYTIFDEAFQDRRDVMNGAACLGHAIANSIFVNAIRKGLEAQKMMED